MNLLYYVEALFLLPLVFKYSNEINIMMHSTARPRQAHNEVGSAKDPTWSSISGCQTGIEEYLTTRACLIVPLCH